MLYELKAIREQRGISRKQAAADLDVPLGTYRNWEQCVNMPHGNEMLIKIAKYLEITVEELFGYDFVNPGAFDWMREGVPNNAIGLKPVKTTAFPVYGRIAAGVPIEMIEVIEEVQAPITQREKHPYSYFLIVTGDSMNNEVLDGSYVLIDPDTEPQNGDTVAVNVNGYDATLKVYHKTANSIILSPNSTNPEHKDLVIDETSPDAPNLRILGKKVWAMYPDKG